MELLTETEPSTAPIPDGAAPYTVWGWKPEHAKKFQDAKGGDIKDLIVNLVRNFQVMANDDTRMIVQICNDISLLGFGFYGLWQVNKILEGLEVIDEAAELYAILEGLQQVGVAVIKLGITVVIIAVLVIFFFMEKAAAGLMVIVNDTDEDLVLEDITSTHGKVIGIFKENPDKDNPKPIIPKKLPPIIDPKTHKPVIDPTTHKPMTGAVLAGFFAVSKRDNALIGPRGALKFRATKSFPQGAYIGWEVPLAQGSNRLHVSATYNDSVSKFSDDTDDNGKQEETSTSTANAKITGRVNSGSGSEAYYVINLAAE